MLFMLLFRLFLVLFLIVELKCSGLFSKSSLWRLFRLFLTVSELIALILDCRGGELLLDFRSSWFGFKLLKLKKN